MSLLVVIKSLSSHGDIGRKTKHGQAKNKQLKIEHCTHTCTVCSMCILLYFPFLLPFLLPSSFLPLSSRIRLRKKTWRTAGTIYLNHQVFEKDIHVFAHFEMYVEPLEGQFVLQDVQCWSLTDQHLTKASCNIFPGIYLKHQQSIHKNKFSETLPQYNQPEIVMLLCYQVFSLYSTMY